MTERIKCAACNGVGAPWNNSASPPCEWCKGLGYFKTSVTVANPDYPTSGSLAYRDSFIRGAEMAGLRDIPDNILSWAIDRAIAAKMPPVTAGRIFGDCYFWLQTDRRYQERLRRGEIHSPTANFLAVFTDELKRNTNKLPL